MGLSSLKGNSGYLGIDKRSEVGSTGTTGNMSVRKVYLERRSGNLEPISPTPSNLLFQDDFASGDLSKWTVYNGSEPSQWEVNTYTACLNSSGVAQTIPSGSTYAAFISDDNGNSNDYTNYSDPHMVFEFTIPSDVTVSSLTLTFDWMCYGERSSGLGSYDYGYLDYIDPSSFTPNAGSEYSTSSSTGRERIIGTNVNPNTDSGKFTGDGSSSRNNNASAGWVTENITIDSSEITRSSLWCDNDCTRGIMFSWASDSGVIDEPGWTIANVKLIYNV